jgi:hypothetical protein
LAKAVELATATGATLELLRAIELLRVLPTPTSMAETVKAVIESFATTRRELAEMIRA